MHLQKLRTFTGLFALLAIATTSCTTSYYAPNPHATAMLTEKNELAATASRTIYDRTFSTDVSAAYSPIENFTVFGSASFFQPRKGNPANDLTFDTYGLAGNLFEGGIGHYRNFSEDFFSNISLSYGRLNNGVTEFMDENRATFNFNRVSLQPGIGYKSDFFDAYASLRFSYIGYQNLQYDSIPQQVFFDEPLLYSNEDFMMVEPGITFRAGYRHFKFYTHVGTSFNLSASDFSRDVFSMSFGVVLNLRPSYKGKPAPDLFDDF
jgi:hypothetical protein